MDLDEFCDRDSPEGRYRLSPSGLADLYELAREEERLSSHERVALVLVLMEVELGRGRLCGSPAMRSRR